MRENKCLPACRLFYSLVLFRIIFCCGAKGRGEQKVVYVQQNPFFFPRYFFLHVNKYWKSCFHMKVTLAFWENIKFVVQVPEAVAELWEAPKNDVASKHLDNSSWLDVVVLHLHPQSTPIILRPDWRNQLPNVASDKLNIPNSTEKLRQFKNRSPRTLIKKNHLENENKLRSSNAKFNRNSIFRAARESKLNMIMLVFIFPKASFT